MASTLSVLPLQKDDHWDDLKLVLGQTPSLPMSSIDGLCAHLKRCGAQCAVIEETYTDRDFSELYSRFYSKLFRRRKKTCRRVHFFTRDLTEQLASGSTGEVTTILETEGGSPEGGGCSSYLGFVVVRPVPHAPLSAAYLTIGSEENGRHLLVRARYEAHLHGATLVVDAAPYTQQDTRVGACAQATIWSVARHYHARHRGPWVSMAGITEAAIEQAEVEMIRTTPYGSEFLNGPAMVRAFRSIGRFPLMRIARAQTDEHGNQHFDWMGDDARSVVSRYLDSGIPVALILAPLTPGGVGHAVTAVGHELLDKADDTGSGHPSRAAFCSAIIVNDDQRGVYRRLPVNAVHREPDDDYPYILDNYLQAIFIPLPDKVYISAEQCERLAWDWLDLMCQNVEDIIATHGEQLGESAEAARQFRDARFKNQLYARTYLTFGYRHKQRLLKNTCADLLKAWIADLDLPRYVWVTEFGTGAGWSAENPKDRRIEAHTVIDATSYEHSDPFIFVHFPGVASRWRHDPDDETKPMQKQAVLISNDKEYLPKIRGVADLKGLSES